MYIFIYVHNINDENDVNQEEGAQSFFNLSISSLNPPSFSQIEKSNTQRTSL